MPNDCLMDLTKLNGVNQSKKCNVIGLEGVRGLVLNLASLRLTPPALSRGEGGRKEGGCGTSILSDGRQKVLAFEIKRMLCEDEKILLRAESIVWENIKKRTNRL